MRAGRGSEDGNEPGGAFLGNLVDGIEGMSGNSRMVSMFGSSSGTTGGNRKLFSGFTMGLGGFGRVSIVDGFERIVVDSVDSNDLPPVNPLRGSDEGFGGPRSRFGLFTSPSCSRAQSCHSGRFS